MTIMTDDNRSNPEGFDTALETLTIVEGSVLDAGTIVVDGVDAVVQELSNLR